MANQHERPDTFALPEHLFKPWIAEHFAPLLARAREAEAAGAGPEVVAAIDAEKLALETELEDWRHQAILPGHPLWGQRDALSQAWRAMGEGNRRGAFGDDLVDAELEAAADQRQRADATGDLDALRDRNDRLERENAQLRRDLANARAARRDSEDQRRRASHPHDD
jgi:hypothetical protein